MTFLNLSSVERKTGKNWSCEKYIEMAESMVKGLSENLSSDEHPLLVSYNVLVYVNVKPTTYVMYLIHSYILGLLSRYISDHNVVVRV